MRRNYTLMEPDYEQCLCIDGQPCTPAGVRCRVHFWLTLRSLAGIAPPRPGSGWPRVFEDSREAPDAS